MEPARLSDLHQAMQEQFEFMANVAFKEDDSAALSSSYVSFFKGLGSDKKSTGTSSKKFSVIGSIGRLRGTP